MKFDLEAAKKAGYTDEEIAAFLAEQQGFDLGAAKKAGYATSEILNELTLRIDGQSERSQETANVQQPPNPFPPSEPLPTASTERQNSFVRGMADPLQGSAQLLEKALPDSWAQKINAFNNWLVDKGIPLERMPEGGFDEWLRQDEAIYQNARKADGEDGIDWGRLGGNIASPMNAVVATKAAQAATLPGRIAGGAATGAVMGAAQPVTEGDFADEKIKQAVFGGVAGGVLPVAAGAASRIIKPKSNPATQKLMDEGITPTVGQALGGAAKRAEDTLRSVPIVGDAIMSGQHRALDDFNKAVINRALKPLGKELPKSVKPGRDAFNFLSESVSTAYDDLLPKLTARLDKKLTKDLSNLSKLTRNLPDDRHRQFTGILKNEVFDRFTKHGRASGETFKEIDSELGSMARAYIKSQNYDERKLGAAIREAQASLRRMINRQNPTHKGKLKQIDKSYAEFLRAERASTSVSVGEDGIFTPAQYHNAVKVFDSSKGKRKFAKGEALGQDLSSTAKDVLANQYPDSGTARRLFMGGAAVTGGAAINPLTLLPAAIGSLPYLPGVQKVAANALARRPDFAAPMANAVKRSGPFAAPGFISLDDILFQEENTTPK